MPVIALTLRAYVRYVVPLVVLSAIAFAPFALVAWRLGNAADAPHAKGQLQMGWVMVGVAWMIQLWLVAAAAPLVRAVATKPIGQARALVAGLRGLVIGFVPAAAAVVAIWVGLLALAVPGLILIVLLLGTGASPRLAESLPLPFADAADAARRHLRAAIIIAVALFALDAAIGLVSHFTIVHSLKKPVTTDALIATRKFVRTIVLALIALSPLPACAAAALVTRSSQR